MYISNILLGVADKWVRNDVLLCWCIGILRRQHFRSWQIGFLQGRVLYARSWTVRLTHGRLFAVKISSMLPILYVDDYHQIGNFWLLGYGIIQLPKYFKNENKKMRTTCRIKFWIILTESDQSFRAVFQKFYKLVSPSYCTLYTSIIPCPNIAVEIPSGLNDLDDVFSEHIIVSLCPECFYMGFKNCLHLNGSATSTSLNLIFT